MTATVTRIARSARVPYSAEEMYALVQDVDSYPRFVPWCTDAGAEPRDGDRVLAWLTLAKGRVRHTLATENTLEPGRAIRMRLVRGPFRRLHGAWRFEPEGERACRVTLELEFEFASRLLALTLGPLFEQLGGSLVEAFRRRAVECYGARS